LLKRGLRVGAVLVALAGFTFFFYYIKYARIVDYRLKHGTPFATSVIYSAPTGLQPGDEGSPALLAEKLQQAGYGASSGAGGRYALNQAGPNSIAVFPPHGDAVVIHYANNRIVQIQSLSSR